MVLYYTILCCTVLYYITLYYTILYYIMLYYTTLCYFFIPYYTILYCTLTIPHYTILYCAVLYYTLARIGGRPGWPGGRLAAASPARRPPGAALRPPRPGVSGEMLVFSMRSKLIAVRWPALALPLVI